MGSRNQEAWLLENGNNNVNHKGLSKEMRHGRTAHNMSSSSMRKKSDLTIVTKLRSGLLRNILVNIQEVILGTKLSVLFPAIPLAVVAQCFGFARPWVFALSLLGLTPLAERVSFLTEQVAYYTGPTVGGLLNATCGNVTELIIAIFALSHNKIAVVKYSLLGSILSNLLLVLGTSLFCGGIANLRQEQKYDREDDEEGDNASEEAVIGFWSAIAWLVGMTVLIALLSEYVVQTIEDASDSWGLSISFLSIILLPIVGNAAEHAGAIIFAFKNKLDITLGVSLGSSTQISMFVVPLCVIVSWILGIKMDLNLNLLETVSLAVAIVTTAFALQDGTSHYMKGLVLILCYVVIGACFFVQRIPFNQSNVTNVTLKPATEAAFTA
ncbi:vacuolar cation/proton exchanger 1-like isoform X4 [Abrus precatorius]|uniref:Vacuolar cation/proton exchanger 1-like isoform X4 n=1 Tax=Abrus precatorius TaxID=3816 RepID=A0A8B8JS15_ABRPR|nr:vacuolar cation/proton exchanger 1-like isoform X4 [Abrus precatorius]